jgi:DNA-binding NtrC family response regulator
MPSVLIVDDEPEIRHLIRRCLQALDVTCLEASSGREAVESVRRHDPAVVLLDVRLPDMHGLEVLRAIRQVSPGTPVLMLTAFDDSRIAVQAIQQGADDYMTKPLDVHYLTRRVRDLLEAGQLRTGLETVGEPAESDLHFYGLVGRSASIRRVFQWIRRIAPTDLPVLITGESGTGKRRVAEVIHRLSPRAGGPFVTVDCGTIPSHLLESELFGYERGAFTGADQRKVGRIELAQGGTVLLDEIANLPPDGQVKLLQALDEKVVFRLGGTAPVRLDVRIVVASNQDLRGLVDRGQFREDLYYRLNVFELRLPPLRERPEDIPLLVEYFLRHFADRYGKAVRGFHPEAMALLLRHTWPGNVRELRNVVERGIVLADRWIGVEHLPPEIQALAGERFDVREAESFAQRARALLEETEKYLIREALDRTGGDRRAAARLLGISPRTLYYKMERYFPREGRRTARSRAATPSTDEEASR